MQFVKEKSTYLDKETKCLLDFIRQWEKENPEEEMVFITLPKYDQEERKRILESVVKFLSEENFARAENKENCQGEG